MNTLTILAIIFLVSVSVVIGGGLILLHWVARGESDVNGDPERDAGLVGDDVRSRSSDLIECESCGATFDATDFDQVIYHTDHIHRPDIQYSGARRVISN